MKRLVVLGLLSLAACADAGPSAPADSAALIAGISLLSQALGPPGPQPLPGNAYRIGSPPIMTTCWQSGMFFNCQQQ